MGGGAGVSFTRWPSVRTVGGAGRLWVKGATFPLADVHCSEAALSLTLLSHGLSHFFPPLYEHRFGMSLTWPGAEGLCWAVPHAIS